MDNQYKRKNYNRGKPSRGGGGGYNNWSNKKFKHYLEPGMQGFLCTYNNFKERESIRESHNILNEYADKLYGSIQQPSSNETSEKAESKDTGDIEDELKEELSNLKSSSKASGKFSTVETGVKNNIFIKSTVEDPSKLAFTILNDIATTKTQKSRFILRLVPVEVTCKAYLEDIKKAAEPLFAKHFCCEPTTFAVVVNKRYNDSILRDEVIHALALLVTDRNADHKANLKEAKQTVLVEIMKGLCCISVVEDYKRLRHYNLAELVKPPASEGAQGGADGEMPTEGKELEDVEGKNTKPTEDEEVEDMEGNNEKEEEEEKPEKQKTEGSQEVEMVQQEVSSDNPA